MTSKDDQTVKIREKVIEENAEEETEEKKKKIYLA